MGCVGDGLVAQEGLGGPDVVVKHPIVSRSLLNGCTEVLVHTLNMSIDLAGGAR